MSVSCSGSEHFKRDGETYTCVLETENSNYLFDIAETFIVNTKRQNPFTREEPPFDLTDEQDINQLFKDMKIVYNKHGKEYVVDLDLTFTRADNNEFTLLGVWYRTLIERPGVLKKRIRRRRPTVIKLVFTSPHKLSVQASVSKSHIDN